MLNWGFQKRPKFFLCTISQCFQNRTGPAGSTGWTANRTGQRSGLELNPESSQEPLETG